MVQESQESGLPGQNPDERQAWLVALFESRHDALGRMVAARLDPRLSGRTDPADLMQEAYLAALRRLDDYLDRVDASGVEHDDVEQMGRCSPTIWLRGIVLQTLCDQYRRHFGTRMRDVRCEFGGGAEEDLSVGFLAEHLAADQTSPSEAVVRQEQCDRIAESLRRLSALDREILILRHFEQLDNVEIARLLQITPSAASARYVRAIVRIRGLILPEDTEHGTGEKSDDEPRNGTCDEPER